MENIFKDEDIKESIEKEEKMGYEIDEGTKKGLLFVGGVLIALISILNYEKYQIISIIGIFIAIFLIVKALS